MGRRAVGVEILAERAALVRDHVAGEARVVVGDARCLASLVTDPVDLCLTSPPYMTAIDHPQNPLTGYRTLDGHYPTYLTELAAVFADVARLLRPGGHAVVNVGNVAVAGADTPLAWDVAGRVSAHLRLQQVVSLCWDVPPPGLGADYCLIFEKAGRSPRDRCR